MIQMSNIVITGTFPYLFDWWFIPHWRIFTSTTSARIMRGGNWKELERNYGHPQEKKQHFEKKSYVTEIGRKTELEPDWGKEIKNCLNIAWNKTKNTTLVMVEYHEDLSSESWKR